MALTASCPSCGAPVEFKSAASIFAVCAYCQSTLVRHDQALEDIGKMAALVEDRSPLQLGAEGCYRDVHFALIGRIQINYSQGLWNEWHLLFDDQRTGWLSEAGGEYALTFAEYVADAIPAFADVKIGQRLLLASQAWTVSNIERAECIAGQGELPFKVGAGYPLAAVDLRNGRNLATLDYSETPPLLFVGEAVDFTTLQMTGLRQGMAIPTTTVTVRVFRCPACGAPMQARSPDILAVGCAACGTVVNTADENYQILSRARGLTAEQYQPHLALGSHGVFDGQALEVIGFLVKQSNIDGITYDWREYLLAAEHGRYRWLTEYNGHWNIVDGLLDPPLGEGAPETAEVRWRGQAFKHFSTTPAAEVIQVAGEFTWRVRCGETSRVVDYIAPPLLLSRESSQSALSWSQGRYVAPAELAEAFRLAQPLPEPIGIFANQPNPLAERRRASWQLFWKLALLAMLAQAYFVLVSSEQLLLRQDFVFSPQMADETQLSNEFEVRDRPRKLTVRNMTWLDNNWIGLDMTLVNKATGAAWPVSREIAFYSGVDGGERWYEGTPRDEVVFLNIPPGTYYLAVDADLAPENPVAVRDRLEVMRSGAGWSNFVLVMLFLAAFPLLTWLRHAAFEARRWMESDHAQGGDN